MAEKRDRAAEGTRPGSLPPGEQRRGAGIEARRDLVVDLYLHRQMSEREVAAAAGVSATTVHFDLVARGVTPRPQIRGLRRGLATPEHLRSLQEGNRRYRAEVERMKVERGLINVDELLERLREADIHRTPQSIDNYVRARLLEPERGLGFERPRLFTGAEAERLIKRLQHRYRDGRLQRFNDPMWRAAWIKAHNGIRRARRAWGRANTTGAKARGSKMGRGYGKGPVLTPDLQQLIVALQLEGRSNRAIAREIHVSEATVRRFRPAS
jgi:transposase